MIARRGCKATLLTGRHGMFPSYEAFLNIIVSMMDQFSKFLKMSQEISLAFAHLFIELPGDLHALAAGTQWFLASKPRLH